MRAVSDFDLAIAQTRDATGEEAQRGACDLAQIAFDEADDRARFYDRIYRLLAVFAGAALIAAVVMIFADVDQAGPIVSGIGTLFAGGGALFVKSAHDDARKAATEAIELVGKYCGPEKAQSLTGA